MECQPLTILEEIKHEIIMIIVNTIVIKVIIIIITRPRPAFGRLGLGGLGGRNNGQIKMKIRKTMRTNESKKKKNQEENMGDKK